MISKKDYYLRLMHAMQSGIKARMEWELKEDPDRRSTSPKHLRVGVNSALCSNGALLALLVKKKMITEDEYLDALIETLEKEVLDYESELSKKAGIPVHLM